MTKTTPKSNHKVKGMAENKVHYRTSKKNTCDFFTPRTHTHEHTTKSGRAGNPRNSPISPRSPSCGIQIHLIIQFSWFWAKLWSALILLFTDNTQHILQDKLTWTEVQSNNLHSIPCLVGRTIYVASLQWHRSSPVLINMATITIVSLETMKCLCFGRTKTTVSWAIPSQ